MKVFVGCSSSDTIDKKYFEGAQLVSDILIKNKCEVMMGCSLSGLMGVVTKAYHKAKLPIKNICIEHYKEDMDSVPGDKELVKDVNVQLKRFMENDILIYLPGGYGTLNELFFMINAYVLCEHNAKIIVINIDHYFDGAKLLIDKIKSEKFATKLDFVSFIDNINDLDKLLKEGK